MGLRGQPYRVDEGGELGHVVGEEVVEESLIRVLHHLQVVELLQVRGALLNLHHAPGKTLRG